MGVSRLQLENIMVHGLEPVSMVLEGGVCTGLSGASGSGKSLLLRAIADLDCHQGELVLDDRLSRQYSGPQWRRLVAYLPAETAWWYTHVGEHFVNCDEVDLLNFEKLNFDQTILDAPTEQLSSGERQRLGLLRLLSQRPRVILLDEPTASLDVTNTAALEQLIKAYQIEHKAAILWVSHDPAQIERVATHAYCIRENQVVKQTEAPS